ncbi:MAG: hypothetical protein HFG62_07970 [Lachnospiraceae bacterium]|jgi:hypothetical protein|nr:hypothetical protein [Lachnospiraceae bacterium]
MAQTAAECLEFLREARDALDELSLLTEQEKQLGQEERKLEKSLEAEKKLVADTIQQTVKTRRGEISSSFETEISKVQENLKKVRTRREKARSQGIKDRITEETAGIHEQNRSLRAQMKTLLRSGHTPWLSRNDMYFSLFMPRFFREYLVLLVFLLAVFLALPMGLYFLIPDHKPLYLAGIYMADIFLIGGGYVLVSNQTKAHPVHGATLRSARTILNDIYRNQKQIRSVTAAIRKDRNESQYNLEKFDDEISRLKQELDTMVSQKNEALNTFENVTRNILADEIEHNHQEKLDGLKSQYQQVSSRLADTRQKTKSRNLYVAEHYGTYLGREFLDPLKIVELTAIVQEGRAANVSEAIAMYRKERQKEGAGASVH